LINACFEKVATSQRISKLLDKDKILACITDKVFLEASISDIWIGNIKLINVPLKLGYCTANFMRGGVPLAHGSLC
jgi:hypothetical protein